MDTVVSSCIHKRHGKGSIDILGKFAKFPSGELSYQILVISGLLPMQYFNSALTNSSMSVVSNAKCRSGSRNSGVDASWRAIFVRRSSIERDQ